jgi:hypothetical protein
VWIRIKQKKYYEGGEYINGYAHLGLVDSITQEGFGSIGLKDINNPFSIFIGSYWKIYIWIENDLGWYNE